MPDELRLEDSSFKGDRITARSWRALLASPSAIVTLARDDSAPVGAAVILQRANTSVARLYSISIAPRARGRGISRRLLDDAVQRMRYSGAAVLRLETSVDNEAAQHLFRQAGFVERGHRPR